MKEKIRYELYVSKTKILLTSLIFLVFIILTIFFSTTVLYYLMIFPVFILCFIILIESLSYYQFSPNGKRYHNKLHDLILDRIIDCQTILDIGCGTGDLTIAIAKKKVDSNVMGVDSWEKKIGYGKKQCIINSKLEGVNNTDYFNFSSKRIDLENGTVDCIVSCLAIYKIGDKNIREIIINEAFRILKTGGIFVFIDLFGSERYFPENKTMETFVKKHNCRINENIEINKLLKLPFPLNSAIVLKHARLITGIKNNTK